MRRQFLYIITFSIAQTILLFSCKKDGDSGAGLFYGRWKTSYGDTIVFARTNGKNIVSYDISMNPGLPANSDFEYAYRDNKLGIKDERIDPSSFRFFQSFKWLEDGKSFEVQGVEWFTFMSSTLTYFTFTKIP